MSEITKIQRYRQILTTYSLPTLWLTDQDVIDLVDELSYVKDGGVI